MKLKKFGSMWLTILLVMGIALSQVGFAAAKGNKASGNPPDQLTSEQMKNAVAIPEGAKSSSLLVEGIVYQFENCDKKIADNPCYFIVTSNRWTHVQNTSSIVPLASSATLTCGRNIYNGYGVKVATLQQNVNATFSGTFGQTPVKLNWGNLSGTATYAAYYTWNNLTGPNPNPNWGVQVTRTGSAYATSGGMSVFSPPPPLFGSQAYASVTLTINSSGWYCS